MGYMNYQIKINKNRGSGEIRSYIYNRHYEDHKKSRESLKNPLTYTYTIYTIYKEYCFSLKTRIFSLFSIIFDSFISVFHAFWIIFIGTFMPFCQEFIQKTLRWGKKYHGKVELCG